MDQASIEQSIQIYRDSASKARKEKRYQEAIDLFEKAWSLAKNYQLHDALNEIIPSYLNVFYDAHMYAEGIEYHQDALSYAIRIGDIKLQARLYTGLGALLWFDKRFEEALSALLVAREKSEQCSDNEMLIKALTNLALVESSRDNIEKSLDYYRELFTLAEEQGAQQDLLTACLNMQAMYFEIGDYDRSLEYGFKGLNLAHQKESMDEIAAFINNIGNVYTRRKEYDKALEFYIQGIELLDTKHAKPAWIANNYLNIGMSYVHLQQYEEGERYLQKAIDIADKHPTYCRESRARAMANLSIILIHRNQLEEAEKILADIIPRLDQLDLGYNRLFFIQSYAEILTRRGKHVEAIDVYRMALEKTIKQFEDNLTTEIAKAQTLLDHDMKVREANLLKRQNRELERKNRELEEAQETIRDLERKNTIYAMAVTTNHELNQPLMIIRGNLEMLTGSCDIKNESCSRYIDRISTSVDRIEKILTKYRTAERSSMGNYSEDTPMVNFEMD